MTSIQSSDWKKQLPMAATISRFLAAPFIFAVVLLQTPYAHWWAAGLFILASITDWLDGYWARKYDAHTNMGKLMDPVADKVLVLSALMLLLQFDLVDSVGPTLLVSRDIFIGGIRSVAAANNVVIDAKPTGKWKAALQMIAIPCLFLGTAPELAMLHLNTIGRTILWISVVLSVISAIQYTLKYRQEVKS
jgi:CDP-diacylglycerol--glycerol-3-phosphate 3-phosphatidyltransferase